MALVLLHHPLRHHAGAGVFVTERVSTWRSLYCSRVSSICRWCFFSLTVMCAFLPAVCDRSFQPLAAWGTGALPLQGARDVHSRDACRRPASGGAAFPRCCGGFLFQAVGISICSPAKRKMFTPSLLKGATLLIAVFSCRSETGTGFLKILRIVLPPSSFDAGIRFGRVIGRPCDALAGQNTIQGRVIGRPTKRVHLYIPSFPAWCIMMHLLSPAARSAPARCPSCGPQLRRTPQITGAPP